MAEPIAVGDLVTLGGTPRRYGADSCVFRVLGITNGFAALLMLCGTHCFDDRDPSRLIHTPLANNELVRLCAAS